MSQNRPAAHVENRAGGPTPKSDGVPGSKIRLGGERGFREFHKFRNLNSFDTLRPNFLINMYGGSWGVVGDAYPAFPRRSKPLSETPLPQADFDDVISLDEIKHRTMKTVPKKTPAWKRVMKRASKQRLERRMARVTHAPSKDKNLFMCDCFPRTLYVVRSYCECCDEETRIGVRPGVFEPEIRTATYGGKEYPLVRRVGASCGGCAYVGHQTRPNVADRVWVDYVTEDEGLEEPERATYPGVVLGRRMGPKYRVRYETPTGEETEYDWVELTAANYGERWAYSTVLDVALKRFMCLACWRKSDAPVFENLWFLRDRA